MPLSNLSDESREWMRQNFDHMVSRYRSQADTAKLVVTFTLAVAATLVATALQVGDSTVLDLWSTLLLAVAGIVTLLVVMLDRIKEADRLLVSQALHSASNADDQHMVLAFAESRLRVENDRIISSLTAMSFAQILFVLAASSVAAYSLLTGGR